jgi:predicted metal-dependent hydrolase
VNGEVPAEPVLSPEEADAFRRGVSQFNDGLFFECHDTLEELWTGLRGPSRDFFQGLIQVAVAFHHLSNLNAGGAASMMERALGRFRAYPRQYFGFDLDAQRDLLRAWRERLASPGWEQAPAERPRWEFGEA